MPSRLSREAIVRRLEDLRLVRRGTWDWFQENGGITDAQSDEVLGHSPETWWMRPAASGPAPQRLALLVREAWKQDLYSEGQLAGLLDLGRVEVRELLDGAEEERVEAAGACRTHCLSRGVRSSRTLSAIINLNATGRAEEIFRLFPAPPVVTETVRWELQAGEARGHQDIAGLDALVRRGACRVVEVGNGAAIRSSLVEGRAADTLGDGGGGDGRLRRRAYGRAAMVGRPESATDLSRAFPRRPGRCHRGTAAASRRQERSGRGWSGGRHRGCAPRGPDERSDGAGRGGRGADRAGARGSLPEPAGFGAAVGRPHLIAGRGPGGRRRRPPPARNAHARVAPAHPARHENGGNGLERRPLVGTAGPEGPRAACRHAPWATEAPEASPPPICTEGENHPAGRRRAVRCAVAQRDEGTRHA